MKLYLISQNINNGWDTYDSAVVVAENEGDARKIHPSGHQKYWDEYSYEWVDYWDEYSHEWVAYDEIEKIEVEYIGETTKPRGVILASFNAG